jgi:8-oxo-dGTP pyrophosphatase MutT (NUDIX family)
LICFRINTEKTGTDRIEYLIIQRKNSIAYTDIIRGKFNKFNDIIQIYLEEMNLFELFKLKTFTFEQLWDDIFINKYCKIYTSEYKTSKTKFEYYAIQELVGVYYDSLLINNFNIKYPDSEYGFPKGRLTYKESIMDCAIRECNEETGYSEGDYTIQRSIVPYKEFYTGDNNKEYIHIYYVAKMNKISTPLINLNNYSQAGEIKSIKWYPFKEAYKLFRDYHFIKKNILYTLHKQLIKRYLI